MIRLIMFLLTGYWNFKRPWHRHIWKIHKEIETEKYDADDCGKRVEGTLPTRRIYLYILSCKECGAMKEYHFES